MIRRLFLRAAAALGAGAALSPRLLADDAPKDNAKDAGATAFACDLYGKLAGKPGNLFFSPLSISAALTMTSAGAAGTTLDEMTKVLHLPADNATAHTDNAKLVKNLLTAAAKAKNELRIANGLWTQSGFPLKPEFVATLKTNYLAAPHEVDFKNSEAARKQINDWVEQQTKDKIKDLLPQGSIDALTRLVLANAVYFQGDWLRAFDAKATTDTPFKAAGGSTQVPMMRQNGFFEYGEGTDWQALGMNYQGNALQMVVVLPKADDGLAKLEAGLSAKTLGGIAKSLHGEQVRVGLPRFKMTGDISLKPTLESLGMVAAFGKADFSRMTSAEDLYISAVVHKAFVDVTEKGTEAAAATGVVVGARSAAPGPMPKSFVADHPFLFLIRERGTGTVLFLGRYVKP